MIADRIYDAGVGPDAIIVGFEGAITLQCSTAVADRTITLGVETKHFRFIMLIGVLAPGQRRLGGVPARVDDRSAGSDLTRPGDAAAVS